MWKANVLPTMYTHNLSCVCMCINIYTTHFQLSLWKYHTHILKHGLLCFFRFRNRNNGPIPCCVLVIVVYGGGNSVTGIIANILLLQSMKQILSLILQMKNWGTEKTTFLKIIAIMSYCFVTCRLYLSMEVYHIWKQWLVYVNWQKKKDNSSYRNDYLRSKTICIVLSSFQFKTVFTSKTPQFEEDTCETPVKKYTYTIVQFSLALFWGINWRAQHDLNILHWQYC